MNSDFMKEYIEGNENMVGKTIKHIGNLDEEGHLYIITDDGKWTVLNIHTPWYDDYESIEVNIYPESNPITIGELLENNEDFVELLEVNTNFNFSEFLNEKQKQDLERERQSDLIKLKSLIREYKSEAIEIIKVI